ncbi:hypothetical protein [Streptomyces luteireticuli]|uniref:Uncharacterized protein n=1 Tax=Streptomyces luteireticuli TaxID=173858 RepID=A0ABN0YS47_9ACTN
MKSRAFRLAPVAVVTAGLLFAGTAGAAVAAPPDDSPSPSSSATTGDTSSPPSEQEEKQAKQETEQLAKAHWDKHGPYYGVNV